MFVCRAGACTVNILDMSLVCMKIHMTSMPAVIQFLRILLSRQVFMFVCHQKHHLIAGSIYTPLIVVVRAQNILLDECCHFSIVEI